MPKFHSLSLNLLFISVLIFIFALSTIFLTIIASNSISNLGNFAANITEIAIHRGASFLFIEKTKRQAAEYSYIFDDASDMVDLLSIQLSSACQNYQYYQFTKSELSKYSKFNSANPKKTITATLDNNAKFVYWGETEYLPLNIKKRISYFSNYFALLEYIKKKSPYYFACWITFKNEEFLITNLVNKESQKIPDRKTVKYFFNQHPMLLDNNWTDVYVDITGQPLISTFKDVKDKAGNMVALAGLDIDVNKLINEVMKDDILGDTPSLSKPNDKITPFIFILNGNNTRIISFPDKFFIPFDLPPSSFKSYDYHEELKLNLSDSKNKEIKNLSKLMLNKNEGYSIVTIEHIKCLIAYSRIPSNKWILAIVYPMKDLLDPIQKTKLKMNKIETFLFITFILVAIVFLVIIALLISRYFKKFVLSPILELRRGVSQMIEGDFNVKLEETGILEVKGLTRSFNRMENKIRHYIKTLQGELLERHSIENEIEVAKKIQKSLLPELTSIFERPEFDLYAQLLTAKRIAGNCYDFFYLKKNKIALFVSDVSGKGISAAFYMNVVKSSIRDICLLEADNPSKALIHVNKFLSEEHKIGMYVSLFLVYYDTDTGILQYGNAGHFPAIHISNNNNYSQIGLFDDSVLGFYTDISYHSEARNFHVGDNLILVSKGLIDATNDNGETYGEKKLMLFLNNNRSMNSEELCQNLISTVKKFINNKLTDDITVLAFKRKK